MDLHELDMFHDRARSNWVRLRTLTTLRWIAITGQTVVLLVSHFLYDLRFESGFVAMTVGASVLANLFATFLYPQAKRLSEREATGLMSFDVFQIGVLLYLTGGLSNPFALLMLAPVTIAATVLHLRSTALVGAMAIAVVSMIALDSHPLQTEAGVLLVLPGLFRFGFWLALVIGIVFLAVYARQVTNEMHAMSEALVATQLALAREQKLTDLGGVVAAAAHELGTPLATIKLTASELTEELGEGDLREDARLIGQQADRCRDILRSMGRAGKDDLHLKSAPLEEVLREAAEPHAARGPALRFDFPDSGTGQPVQPEVLRRPEIIHGLRNLIQNAVDFADREVVVTADWTDDEITVRIADDGPGFPPQHIGRIGDPFLRRRRDDRDRRPGYEGMGLGLFIAKTLLERSGARLSFANGGRAARVREAPPGAIVLVTWPRARLDPRREGRSALGANPQLT